MSLRRGPPDNVEKAVLFIINRFAPPVTGGTIRIYKFAKYLLRRRWQVFVITNSIEKMDALKSYPSLAAELSGIHILDAPGIDEKIHVWIKRFRKSDRSVDPREPQVRRSSPRTRLRSLIQSGLKKAAVPDIWRYLWVGVATRKARSAIREFGITNVVTSSPSHSTQLVGLRLKRHLKNRIHWVADFRDLWSMSPNFEGRSRLKIKNRRMEKQVLLTADRVIFNTDPGRTLMLSELEIAFDPNRYHVIPNGFDEEDFKAAESGPESHGKIEFNYFGDVYGPRAECRYVEAIKAFTQRNGAEDLVFNFYGVESTDFVARVKALECASIKLHCKVAHPEAIRLMCRSGVLVAFWNDSLEGRVAVNGKLYEYLRARRPILVLFPAGEVTRLITENGLGETGAPSDVEDIVRAMEKIIRNLKVDGHYRTLSDERLSQYDRERLTSRLEKLLVC